MRILEGMRIRESVRQSYKGGQSMKKFERNTGRILPNTEPVSIVSRSSSDAQGGQGRMLDVSCWTLDLFCFLLG